MNSQLSQLRFWQSLRWWGLWWDRISPLWASFGSRDSKDGYTPRPSKYGSRDASGTSENGSRTSTSNDGWLLSPCFLRLSSGMNGSLINLSGTSMYTTYFSSLYRDVGAYQCLDNLFFFFLWCKVWIGSMCSDQVIIPFHSRREIFVTTMGTSEPNKRDWQVYLILILTPVMGSLTWVGFRVNLLRISISHTPRVLLWVLSFFTCAYGYDEYDHVSLSPLAQYVL